MRRVRRVRGATFDWRNERWTDRRVTRSTPRLRVRYLSSAYFSLLTEFPDLKHYFGLGDSLLVLYRGVAIEVGSSGADALSEDQLERLR